ncbi:hypothetical protein J7T55_013425 [Diaporthe amygdali]|uniref:uncharacterized protein n=1 Tax=Phomopsis amygdali TaxID=1214568 RepID=UPI0022FE00BE|nr:uncharacterized protein J7T55_013425 [Diaporthe amygdali]KAJ0119189.1 hypothetical protein J7T55_013425 [Diaporthe amygdali]
MSSLGSAHGRKSAAGPKLVDLHGNPLVSLTNLQKHQAQRFRHRRDRGRLDFALFKSRSMPYPPSSSSLIAKCGTTITCVLRSVPLWVVVIVVLLFGFARRRISQLLNRSEPLPPPKE